MRRHFSIDLADSVSGAYTNDPGLVVGLASGNLPGPGATNPYIRIAVCHTFYQLVLKGVENASKAAE